MASLRGVQTSNYPALKRRTGYDAMTSVTTNPDSSQPTGETAVYLFDNRFDPIEVASPSGCEFIHAIIEGELHMALSRPRYARHASCRRSGGDGRRHRSPPWPSIAVADGKLRPGGYRGAARQADTPDGKTTSGEQGAAGLSAAHACCRRADRGRRLAGTDTRRVRRALASLFGGAVGKDTVKQGLAQGEDRLGLWNAACLPKNRSCGSFSTAQWCACGSTAKRLPSRSSLSLAYARYGQKVLLAIKSMGGETTEAWRTAP